MRRREGRHLSPTPPDSTRVLVISASMGAGHDGAAKNLAARLRAQGHHAEVKDFLESGPLRIGSALRSGYEFELKHIPSAYGATYRLWYRVPWLCPVVAWLVTALTRRRVMGWVRDSGATVVVSTYPLATLCLGRLRATGRLGIPAVNFITDFGVHPLWVHRGVDVNLAIHEAPARMAAQRTKRPSLACGPVVSETFDPVNLPGRDEARRQLGLTAQQRAVLVVAGSWGVGDVHATWSAIAEGGRFTPVVVCGLDERLQQQVSALAESAGVDSAVIGWTDDMPALMAACDALVENAGGLTSLEAMRSGLPVVSFHPIAGHGVENTAGMASAGVSRLAADPAQLAVALDTVTTRGPEREEQLRRAHSMFQADAADLVRHVDQTSPRFLPEARRPVAIAVRFAVALTGVAGLGWLGLTSGVALAAEAGAGVAHPAADASSVAYIGVRLDTAEISDPAVGTDLKQMGLTAVVDDATAEANLTAIRQLAGWGVQIENGGLGDPLGTRHDNDSSPWKRALGDARAGVLLESLIGKPVTMTVPGRRVDAWDLIDCRRAHTSLVVPNHILEPDRPLAAGTLIHLSARHIYVVNGFTSTPKQLLAYLSQLKLSLQAAHLSAATLSALA